MVDLQDMPQLKNLPTQNEKEAKRQSTQRNRVRKEIAPKGKKPNDRISSLPQKFSRSIPRLPAKSQQVEMGQQTQHEPEKKIVPNLPIGEGILRPKKDTKKDGMPELTQLFPSANKLARLEENYRKKYGPEVEEGETKFLDTDDIFFGSFLHRFEDIPALIPSGVSIDEIK